MCELDSIAITIDVYSIQKAHMLQVCSDLWTVNPTTFIYGEEADNNQDACTMASPSGTVSSEQLM